jgi:NADH-ubiquinone oxidoreductase chain 1
MTNYLSLISVLEVLIVTVPVLLSVAYVTIAERKTMASMQRRLGPNVVGFYGSLQAFADALKLLLKEYVSPAQANLVLFFLGPIITLIFALFGYLVVPFGVGLVLGDLDLGIFYMLAVSSLSTYGILLAGWSANSKYAFLGSLRSTAQLISYELVLSSGILVVIMLTGSLNITAIIEAQKAVWFIVPLFPLFIILFIGSVAETNRAPFDLAEAESELVSGFMTEHAAVIFVFFFLAEYASIVLICILNTILFLGGYLCIDFSPLFNLIEHLYYSLFFADIYDEDLLNPTLDRLVASSLRSDSSSEILNPSLQETFNSSFKGLYSALSLGIKSSIMIFVFIWVRASFPRIRYDQLMSFCWTVILPIIIAFIILVPCILYSFEIIPVNIFLL